MTRLRLWRLRRAYRRIASIEVRLGPNQAAGELRLDFAEATIRRADKVWATKGQPRSARRQRIRDIARAISR